MTRNGLSFNQTESRIMDSRLCLFVWLAQLDQETRLDNIRIPNWIEI